MNYKVSRSKNTHKFGAKISSCSKFWLCLMKKFQLFHAVHFYGNREHMETVILSCLQNDGTRGFSKKKALKTTRASGRNVSESCSPLTWSTENPLVQGNTYF